MVQLLLSCFVLLSDPLVYEANMSDIIECSSRMGNHLHRVLGLIFFSYWNED